MKRIEFRAMGSRILVVLDAVSCEAEQALQCLPAWFEEWENVLSRFRPGNELDRLNCSSGRPISVSQTLWDVLHAARLAEQATGGLVTPTILDALVGAGYDRSFDFLPPVQTGHYFWFTWSARSLCCDRLGCSHPQSDLTRLRPP